MAGVQNEPHPEADLPFRVTALEIEPKTPIRSGEWMAITVRGEVAAHVDPDYRLEIRVRALQNAQIVHVVDLTAREPRLVQPGTFEAKVQLQANMSNGYFSIETPVWHVRERREIGQSMKGLVRVQGAAFFGTTNLHARVQIALNERTSVGSLR
jgi:hypothetical protein